MSAKLGKVCLRFVRQCDRVSEIEHPLQSGGTGMAARPKATSTKRIRERAKVEQRNEKMRRREERKKAKEAELPPEDGTDPDLAGMKPGPQRPQY